MFKTIIIFEKTDREKLEKICEDISRKDKTFIYEFKNDYLVIQSQDRNTAFRRGAWFYYRVDTDNELRFEVVKDGR